MTNQAGFNGTDFIWPYRTSYGTITHVDSDVPVVGGGLAGSCASIAAARRGARVVVADKGAIKHSGCGGPASASSQP